MKKYLLLTIFLLTTFSFFAQQIQFVGKNGNKPVLTIFELKYNDPADRGIALTLSNSIQNQISMTQSFRIVEKSQIQKVLEQQGFELSGLTDSTSQQIGQILAADYIVLGEVISIVEGNQRIYQVFAKIIQTSTAEVISSGQITGLSSGSVLMQIGDLVYQLTRRSVQTEATQPIGTPKQFGTLSIQSNSVHPIEMDLKIINTNGAVAHSGKIPFYSTQFPAATYQIELTHPSGLYLPLSQTIEVRANRQNAFKLKLESNFYELEIGNPILPNNERSSKPAIVYIDNIEVGVTPYKGQLNFEKHTIYVAVQEYFYKPWAHIEEARSKSNRNKLVLSPKVEFKTKVVHIVPSPLYNCTLSYNNQIVANLPGPVTMPYGEHYFTALGTNPNGEPMAWQGTLLINDNTSEEITINLTKIDEMTSQELSNYTQQVENPPPPLSSLLTSFYFGAGLNFSFDSNNTNMLGGFLTLAANLDYGKNDIAFGINTDVRSSLDEYGILTVNIGAFLQYTYELNTSGFMFGPKLELGASYGTLLNADNDDSDDSDSDSDSLFSDTNFHLNTLLTLQYVFPQRTTALFVDMGAHFTPFSQNSTSGLFRIGLNFFLNSDNIN